MNNHISVILLLCVVCQYLSQQVKGDDDNDIRRLHDKMITSNNPMIRPVKNSSHGMTIFLKFSLVSISEFDESAQTVVANIFLTMMWMDQFLRWNSSEYGGVTEIRPDFQKVWRPRITVENTVDNVEPLGQEAAYLNLESKGNVTWYSGEILKVFCTMDVTNFPFDEQTCIYSLFEWGYPQHLMDLQPIENKIDLNGYKTNSEWNITSTNSYRTEESDGETQIAFLHFTMTLKRNPVMKVLTVILPVVLLSLLNVVVFLIPVESGEKLSFAFTVLLSFAVFMSFITGMLPQSADSLPVLTVFVALQFIMSSLYALFTVWTLNIYHRDPSISKSPPLWMTRLTRAMERLSSTNSSRVGNAIEVSQRNPKPDAFDEQNSSDQISIWIRISRAIDKMLFWIFITFFVLSATLTLLKVTHF